ncbi:hypothetical protein SAMN02745116_01759 [Pilibacter termitis]|uniref:Uncharacterized protein n=1 Tax=Pilibacter termitis TaxID=263852 RepID=A0A1T4PCK6_9ENTE|nr:hypothetical protein [Pilibacter termitis]SJZ89315.1 hypothetical protein SAMN02745116_01759 [Pilibacter termitis]
MENNQDLQFVSELTKKQTVLYELENGRTFYDRERATLTEIKELPFETIKLHTLQGLVDYIKSDFEKETDMMIHIESATRVSLLEAVNSNNDHPVLASVTPMIREFNYGMFMDSERFNISVMEHFERTENVDILLTLASKIVVGEQSEINDNGITQEVKMKSGARFEMVEIDNPIELQPYRTFLDVAQPPSPFVFRGNKNGELALFNADGGKWQYLAIENIKEFFNTALKEKIESGKIIVVG